MTEKVVEAVVQEPTFWEGILGSAELVSGCVGAYAIAFLLLAYLHQKIAAKYGSEPEKPSVEDCIIPGGLFLLMAWATSGTLFLSVLGIMFIVLKAFVDVYEKENENSQSTESEPCLVESK